ncbi:DNA-binding protein [Tenacibaculum holothuriorum]|uniref:DNA-binding protein n=1 Tax=Tenacibaculum holothuriorum TaxID=1635173 RepID=A0A1Y2PGC1_9FLAO|nr:DUF177 domain-containing protein [Tenacibaculum holothuriorum]OSY89051.1 DNA-binding protein [Tenacibaculum holothuriorum]
MKDLKEFNIPFVGLKEGSHLFEYHIDKKFFEAYQFEDFNDANINVKVNFVKKSTIMELSITASGTIHVPCDITSEMYNQEIEGTLALVIKFGLEFNDDNEEILILPHEAYQVNIAQYIYELIVLSVPSKRIHPKVIDGTMNSEALKRLKELELKEEKPVEKEKSTDPRWDKLKDLLTDK